MNRQSRALILLTRPQSQSARFADELRVAGAQIVISPLMAPQMIAAQRPDGDFAAVIFTAETGVLAAAGMADLPRRAYVVGARTADAAQAAGFETRVAGGDWRDLLGLIRRDHGAGRLLFLHAAEAAADLPNALSSGGIETVSIPVYRQTAQPLTAQAAAVLRGDAAVIVPLFSARSARLFCAEWDRIGGTAPLAIAAFSAQVAAAVTLRARQLQIAQRPDAQAMADAVAHLAAIS